jgi:hypothetical protein
VSEHLDPNLAVAQTTGIRPEAPLPPARADATADTHTFFCRSTAQGAQLPPSSLNALVDTLSEPALLHQNGRIVALNSALAQLLDHPAPHFLIGLPVDALLEDADPYQTGIPAGAVLRTPAGPRPVILSRMTMAVRDGQGTLWVLRARADDEPTSPPAAEVIETLESLCEDLWDWPHGRPLDRRTVLQRVDSAIHALRPTNHQGVDLGSIVVDLATEFPECTVVVRCFAAVAVPAPILADTVELLLQSLPDGSTLTVDLDLSQRPTLVAHSGGGPALEGATLRACQQQIGALRGSLIMMDDHTVRIRFPGA